MPTIFPTTKNLILSIFSPTRIRGTVIQPPTLNQILSTSSPIKQLETPIPTKFLTLTTSTPELSYGIKAIPTKNFFFSSFSPEILITYPTLFLFINFKLKNNFWEFYFDTETLPFAKLDRSFSENLPTPTRLTILKVLEYYQRSQDLDLVIEIEGELFPTENKKWQLPTLPLNVSGTVGYPPHH